MFSKYQKSSNSTKILLMYLLLNGYSLTNVQYVEEVEEDRKFGLKLKKLYGITVDFVDVKRIEKEIEEIVCPIICSPLSFEYYSNSPVIYTYRQDDEGVPLWLNDLNIISKVMIITENRIVSDVMAKPLMDCEELGFMFFYDYILKDECVVGKWRIQYKDKVFSIFYLSEYEDKSEEVLLFSAIEIDKTSTYKMVIYIIKKASLLINEWQSDNYTVTNYEMVVQNDGK